MTTDYRVRLDAFEGPLDLLLFLIRRAEVDIHDIPIAEIAGQFLEHLRGIERVDIETAGEFLLMAATLMEIKSRMLVPVERSGGTGGEGAERSEEDDPRSTLVRQLLEYKKYRDAATRLEERLEEWQQRYPTASAGSPKVDTGEGEDAIDLDDLSLSDLAEAFGRIIESVNMDRLGEHEVLDDDTPIELHAEDLLDLLSRESRSDRRELRLEKVFEGRTRGAMIGMFIAVLELVRQQRIAVRQDEGVILLSLRRDEAVSPASTSPESEERDDRQGDERADDEHEPV
ncbi:MAG: segregation and condensation protein A [Phycisphaerales bacterium JB037]